MKLRTLLICLLATAIVAPVQVWATDLESIVEQQRALSKDLEGGNLALTPRQRGVVQKAQQEVFALTDGKSSLDELNIAEKTKLENALERINAVVVGTPKASGEKQICKRVALTGTSMKTTRCASAAEWEQLREDSRRSLEKQHVCVPPGCGS